MVFRFCFVESRDARSFAPASTGSSPLPRDLDEEARGASDSEFSTIAVSAALREVCRFGFGGEGERSESLPLVSSSADVVTDALGSEETAINGRR